VLGRSLPIRSRLPSGSGGFDPETIRAGRDDAT
jgi:hypothetical protein